MLASFHPLLRVFIEQIEIAIGDREEISNLVDLTSEQIQHECDRICATIPEVSKVILSRDEYGYRLKYSIKGTACTTDASEFPAVAFWNGVQSFKNRGLNYTLSFPAPLVEQREHPQTRAERQALDRKLRTLQHKFLDDLADEVDSTLFPQDRVELLLRILDDFDCLENILELDPEISVGHESAWETIQEVWQEVESRYYMLEAEAESLAGIVGDSKSFRETPQAMKNLLLEDEIMAQQAIITLGIDSLNGTLAVPPSTETSHTEVITLKQLALLIYFQGGHINDNNAASIVTKYELNRSRGSAGKLADHWRKWCNEKALNQPYTTREAGRLIKDIERIIPRLLNKAERDKAQDQTDTIRDNII